eukprot:2151138-Rhodomonas_salina.1
MLRVCLSVECRCRCARCVRPWFRGREVLQLEVFSGFGMGVLACEAFMLVRSVGVWVQEALVFTT